MSKLELSALSYDLPNTIPQTCVTGAFQDIKVTSDKIVKISEL